MLTIKDPPPLEQDELTTYWPGDPAIAGGDLLRWAATGAADALEVKPGQKPSAIVVRPLDEWETTTLPKPVSGTDWFPMHCVEAARMGLVSIDGVAVPRLREPGSVFGRVPMERMIALRAERAVIPFGVTTDAALVAEFGLEPDLAEREKEGEKSLPEWLGALILSLSFRRRR